MSGAVYASLVLPEEKENLKMFVFFVFVTVHTCMLNLYIEWFYRYDMFMHICVLTLVSEWQ